MPRVYGAPPTHAPMQLHGPVHHTVGVVALFSNRGLPGVGQRLRELIDATDEVSPEEAPSASAEPYRLDARLGAEAVEEIVRRYSAGEPSLP